MGADELPPHVRAVAPPRFLKRVLAHAHLGAIDSGWTRRTPLKTHVVICGFPRAGSTLLSLMLQVAYPQAKSYPRERAALRIAYRTDRNHAMLITKRPDDVFYVSQLRATYRRRRPTVRFLLMMRDPRAVLTSVHALRKNSYYVTPERWAATYQHLLAARAQPDTLTIRFEDMVTNIAAVQESIAQFIGEPPQIPLAQFVDRVPPGFKETALNGVRALDASTASKWRRPKHRARLSAMLRHLPQLPQVLIDWGYERDAEWVRGWVLGGAASHVSDAADV